MPDTFKVGEIGVLQGATRYPQYHGQEALVIGGLRLRRGIVHGRLAPPRRAYTVQCGDGEKFYVLPEDLRKLPPKDTLSTWDASSVWRPAAVKGVKHS